jgi:membrane-bound lytic murein transglycosylase B
MTATIKRLYHKLCKRPIGIFLSSAILWGSIAYASPPPAYLDRQDVQHYIQQLVLDDHLDRSFLEAVFSQVHFVPSAIQAMDKPFKRSPPWYRYVRPLLTEERVNQGQLFWQEHNESLSRAQALYGVPAQVIVAIIGIETFYGRVMGNYRLVDALTTLAFDYPRRGDFFKEELRALLLISQEEHTNPFEWRGSFAGALGFPQFMPSSYRRYGIDFDHDGKVDLLHSPDDAIGSVAYFLREHGWQKESWDVLPVENMEVAWLESHIPEKGISSWHVASEWNALSGGLQGAIKKKVQEERFALLKLEASADHSDYMWVGANFQAITRYNHSRLYASVVLALAYELAEARGIATCPVYFPGRI